MADRPARLVIGARTQEVLHVACWLVIAASVGWMSLQLLGDHVGRWVTPLQALTPWVLPFVFVAAVTALVLHRHPAAFTGAATGIAFLALVAPLAFPAALPDAAPGASLSITHANLLYSNPRIDDAIDALAATGADVIAVSELTPEFVAVIEASEVGRRYPYSSTRPGDAAVGLGIWSRVPLLAGPRLPDSSMTLTAEVELDGRRLVVVLAHPLPPLLDGGRWRAEMAAMAALPADVRERTVVVADLNVSYFHPPLRRFLDRTRMRDVHQAFGEGFSASWPTDEPVPPFVRLDHALVGEGVTATAIDDLAVPGSDHRAFTVDLSWAAA